MTDRIYSSYENTVWQQILYNILPMAVQAVRYFEILKREISKKKKIISTS